jgi:hypothetical protein
MVTSDPLESLRDKIQKHLPDASPDQVRLYALQVERLEDLQRYFQKHQDDLDEWKDKSGAPINEFARAIKALDYKQPYRIAIIGLTGAGKSTLLNAMLGRSLVLMKDIGKPATGAALEIFLDVSEAGTEKAFVSYRDQFNIYALVKDFVERYQLDASKLTGELDAGFVTSIRNLQPPNSLSEGERAEFEKLRKTLADIVLQHANNGKNVMRKEFALANSSDSRELIDLIDENSMLNSEKSPQRRIGLVKAVTYHIKPPKISEGLSTLRLPSNVCLVDLPGLDGTPLHDLIISEGIKDADAVVFIMSAPRILGQSGEDLLNRVRKYVGLDGSTQSGDRIFLVLNARDKIMVDDGRTPDSLPRDMHDLMELLVPDYANYFCSRGGEYPYFMTCAWAALSAQKQLNGEQLEDIQTYDSVKIKLGLKGRSDREILEASQIPKLVKELTKFACENRIEGQIRDGKLALDSIVENLLSNYESELDKLKQDQGELNFQSQEEQKLNEKQKEVDKLVIEFRSLQLNRFEDWRNQLEQEAVRICNQIDDVLKQRMPSIWENSFDDKWNLVIGKPISQRNEEFVVSETQLELWKQLTFYVPRLAQQLVAIYQSNLLSYQLAQKISDGCGGYDVKAEELESMIKQLIEKKMRHTMREVASRIAMTWFTHPDYDLTAKDAEGKLKNQKLFDVIQSIPRQSKPETFHSFVTEFRNHYQDTIADCVTALLNLYRYEMLLIENVLLAQIRRIFGKIRKNPNSYLKSQIRESLNLDPNWQRYYALECKITALKPIKS